MAKKLPVDVITVGAISLVASAATEVLLLAPKTEINLGPNVKIPVQGFFALSQETVSNIYRASLNSILPWSANTMSSLFDILAMKKFIRNTASWLIYDIMGKYSLNTIVTYIFGKVENYDNTANRNAISELIQKYITEKTDRDALIQSITAEIVRVLRVLCEGTLAALIFNDRFAQALSGTIAAAVDRFIQNEAATRVTDFLFDMAGHLEKITIPNMLQSFLGMTREDFESYIDLAYDLLLGDKMVQAFKDAKFGDVAYDLIMGIDFEAAGKYIFANMRRELLHLSLTSVSGAVSMYSGIISVGNSVDKHFGRVRKMKKSIKSVLKKKPLMPKEMQN